jgi:imidazole glycerol-phosphate synthase subunit HisH
MGNRITIVDYGVGNLFSVQRAIEVSGGEAVISGDPAVISAAERLILPGVGAFADGMRGLRERGLVDPIKAYALGGRPLLGICLGMQMLATRSEEFGEHEGLDLIAGRVVAIPRVSTTGASMKVPSIGWAAITAASPAAVQGSCLEGHADATPVYLVHSFHVVPDDAKHLLATYDFGGHRVTAAIRKDNIVGFQFHPEKSGRVGLDIMRKFVGAA